MTFNGILEKPRARVARHRQSETFGRNSEAAAGSGVSISIVVNTYNRARSLRATLGSLHRLSYSPFEVIVVNGPSTDDTEAVLAAFDPWIIRGHCAEANLSASRNIGIRMSSGDLVAFVDDDAIPYEYWLDDLVPHFDSPEVGGVGGFVIDHTGYAFQHRYCAIDRMGNGPLEVNCQPDHYCYPGSPVVPYLQGTNAVFRRDAVLEVGGFDEEYEYCFDETDLCTRLIDAGYLLKQRHCGFVYHRYLPSHVRNENRVVTKWFPVVKNKVYYSIKNANADQFSMVNIADEATRHIEDLGKFLRDCLSAGRITPEQFENFQGDAPAAVEAGLLRGLSRPRLLLTDSQVASSPRQFKQFPSAMRGKRLTICLSSQNYPPKVAGVIGRYTFALANALIASGHIVHVLTQSCAGNTVDYEDGVWVHRLFADSALVPERLWPSSEIVTREIARMRKMYAVDLVDAPACDSAGEVAIADDVSRAVANPYAEILINGPRPWRGDSGIAEILRYAGIAADCQSLTDRFSGIRGWLHAVEGHCLFLLAQRGPGRGAIVEIGSFMGLSTAYLASGSKRAGRERVTVIDHFQGSLPMQQGAACEVPEIAAEGSTYRVFKENMERLNLNDYIVPIAQSSIEVARRWSGDIRLLFIDGDHSYEGSRADFEAFERAVVPGGIVCFHDVDVKEGVTKFFRQLVDSCPDYEHVGTMESLAILVKRPKAPALLPVK